MKYYIKNTQVKLVFNTAAKLEKWMDLNKIFTWFVHLNRWRKTCCSKNITTL